MLPAPASGKTYKTSALQGRSKLSGFLSRRNTASHRLHTRHKALPFVRRGQTADADNKPPCFQNAEQQNEGAPVRDASEKRAGVTCFSYGGMIRIRCKGRRLLRPPLSPANGLPCAIELYRKMKCGCGRTRHKEWFFFGSTTAFHLFHHLLYTVIDFAASAFCRSLRRYKKERFLSFLRESALVMADGC